MSLHPFDGYLYGWRWPNGDYAWWSSVDMAMRHPSGIFKSGEPVRRRYVVGEIEDWAPPENWVPEW